MIVLIHFLLLIGMVLLHTPTGDEPAHLRAGLAIVRHAHFGEDLGNPPLVKIAAALPVVLAYPNYELQLALDERVNTPQAVDACWTFTLARCGCIPFSLLGAYVCYRWSLELHGTAGGLLSLCLWCFSPSILGHGALVVADVAAAATSVLACYTMWQWWRFPTWSNASWAGVALGFALLAKMVCAILFVLFPALWLALRFSRLARRRTTTVTEAAQMTCSLALALLVLNWGYGFERTLRPLQEHGHLRQGRHLEWLPAAWHALPVPLPQNYVLGMWDVGTVVRHSHRSYVAGTWRDRGVWYYYLYGLGIKTPVGLLALLLIAAFTPGARSNGADICFVLIPGVAFLAVVSYSCSAISHHFRYLMPALPFLFVFAGRSCCGRGRPQWRSAAVVIGSVAAIAGPLWTYPHTLSYFNAFAGGPVAGRNHMVDSNLDWGQDLLFLKKWVDAHPDAKPLYVAYWGRIAPELLGIDYELPPPRDHNEPAPGGYYAVSVNFLMGFQFVAPAGNGRVFRINSEDYALFRQLKPIARAGYSIDIYHVGEEARDEQRAANGER